MNPVATTIAPTPTSVSPPGPARVTVKSPTEPRQAVTVVSRRTSTFGTGDAGPEHVERLLGGAHVRGEGGVVGLVGRAAEDGSALDEDRPRADVRDGPRRLQAGRSAADDEDGLRHLRPPRS